MAQKGINILSLPDKILEEIFTYISYDAKKLRQVCKKFKKVFENSSKLMRKLSFDLNKAVDAGAVRINTKYPALTFNDFDSDHFSFIKHKDSIESVHITTCEWDIRCCASHIQNMLYGFESLKHISFYVTDGDIEVAKLHNIKFATLAQSKLESLSITYDAGTTNLLKMFAKVPGIKNLHVCPSSQPLKFPEVVWMLEELTLAGYKMELHQKTFLKFLENQKSTLKVLRLDDAPEYTNFIMLNMINLEKLTIGINGKEKIDTDVLITNEKLRSLTISDARPADYFDSDNSSDYDMECNNNHVEETILNHYKNIKCLHIYSDDGISLKLVNNLELNNLTHLIMRNCISNFLVKAKIPNLKYLAASHENFFDDSYDSAQVPTENFANVEALTIYDWEIEDVRDIIEKFPKLIHLNLGSGDFMNECYLISYVVNDIAPVGSKLAILGIENDCLDNRDETYEKLLTKIENKRINIRIYNGFGAMNFEYWNPKDYGFYREPL